MITQRGQDARTQDPLGFLRGRLRGAPLARILMFARQTRAGAVGQAVAEGAEPAVKRQSGFAVVAFEITVMEVVEIGTRGPLAVEERAVKPMMRACGAQSRVLQIEHEMEWMGRNNPMNENDAQ